MRRLAGARMRAPDICLQTPGAAHTPAVWWVEKPRREKHARQCRSATRGPDSQRRPGRPSRGGEDLAARGAAVRGGGDPAPGLGPGRHARCPTPNPTSRRGRCRSPPTLSSLEWQDRKINLLDTPGEPSFVADALGALRVCESAVFVINAVMGVEVSTARLWARAAELDIARMLFVNMLDRERADFFRTLEQLKSAFGAARRRDRDPDRRRARARRRDRPRRHEGLPRRPPPSRAPPRRSRSPTRCRSSRRSTARS